MRMIFLAALLTLPSAAMADEVRPLFDGVTYRQKVQAGEAPMVVHIITLDLTRTGIKLALTKPDRSKGMEHIAYTTSGYLSKSGAQVAINASYFLPFNGGSPKGEDYYPKEGQPVQVSGMARGGGRQVSPVEIDQDNRVTAIICINGADVRINDGQRCAGRVTDAVSAGPRLLTGGAATSLPPYEFSRNDAKAPRTAFGLSADRKTAWLVVIDGRQAGYSMGASLPEMVTLFRELGASDAINLDGGGSAAMAVAGEDGKPTLLSRPIHTGIPGRERPVANHIIVFAQSLVP
jgi:exopolysaccharide biosynthesis protein